MNLDDVTGIINVGVEAVILTSMPSVGLGLLAGLLVSIFQAVTQIQEQTLTFVPKMIVVFLVLAATFPWMAGYLVDMSVNLWTQIPEFSR